MPLNWLDHAPTGGGRKLPMNSSNAQNINCITI